MHRPDRKLVLSLLACGAAFAQGWQQERERRYEAHAARAAAPTAVALRLPSVALPRAAQAPLTPRHDQAVLDALLLRLLDLDYADWSDADVATLYAQLAAGAPTVAWLLVSRCRETGDCRELGPALESRVAAGDADAAWLLADLYADPDFPGADPLRAFESLTRYAELGDDDAKLEAAQRTLAYAPEDRPEWRARALGWLASAATRGSARAALELLKLHDGTSRQSGIERDPGEAARWYEALRRQADPRLLREAALHYQSQGDAASTTRAIELWTQQGELGGEFGSNNAAWLLAVCGRGLDDYERAWRLIQREHRDHGETWQSVDTLAGVQAQLGMWGDALSTQQRALDMLAAESGGDDPRAERELRARLDAYAALRGPAEPDLCPEAP